MLPPVVEIETRVTLSSGSALDEAQATMPERASSITGSIFVERLVTVDASTARRPSTRIRIDTP